MTPDARLAWTLGLTLLMWAPAGASTAAGGLDILKCGLIFLGALMFSWVGTGIVSHLVDTYRMNNDQLEIAKQQIELLEKQAEKQAARRRTDKTPDSTEDPSPTEPPPAGE